MVIGKGHTTGLFVEGEGRERGGWHDGQGESTGMVKTCRNSKGGGQCLSFRL